MYTSVSMCIRTYTHVYTCVYSCIYTSVYLCISVCLCIATGVYKPVYIQYTGIDIAKNDSHLYMHATSL